MIRFEFRWQGVLFALFGLGCVGAAGAISKLRVDIVWEGMTYLDGSSFELKGELTVPEDSSRVDIRGPLDSKTAAHLKRCAAKRAGDLARWIEDREGAEPILHVEVERETVLETLDLERKLRASTERWFLPSPLPSSYLETVGTSPLALGNRNEPWLVHLGIDGDVQVEFPARYHFYEPNRGGWFWPGIRQRIAQMSVADVTVPSHGPIFLDSPFSPDAKYVLDYRIEGQPFLVPLRVEVAKGNSVRVRIAENPDSENASPAEETWTARIDRRALIAVDEASYQMAVRLFYKRSRRIRQRLREEFAWLAIPPMANPPSFSDGAALFEAKACSGRLVLAPDPEVISEQEQDGN